MKSKYLVVGCGFSGAVIASELAKKGHAVHIIEKRDHIGGNAYDYVNDYGIRVHKYGPHLFHTSNQQVVDWLSKYTEWIPYKHKVKALLQDGRYVTLPVNKETADTVGTENILDIFFRPYTKKMWGIDLEQLDPKIINRVPIRNDLNEYYFPNDTFQAMPKNGYTSIFERIINQKNIFLELNKTFDKNMENEYEHIFNSMPIDEYFNFKFGELPYRSVKFHHHTIPIPSALPVATVNFTHDEKFTRVTEWKKIPGHGENHIYTTLTFEEPCDYKDNAMERYYPVKDIIGINFNIYKKYKAEISENITFIGRCGKYAYLDMHQAISSALSTVHRYLEKFQIKK